MLDKFKEFIGIDDSYDEYDDQLEAENEEKFDTANSYDSDYTSSSKSNEVYSNYNNNSYKSDYSSSSRKVRGGDNIVSMTETNYSTNNRFRISIQEPVNYDEDAPKVVDDILNKKVVVLNLEMIEVDKKRQIFDFVSGAVYALGGKIEKVTKGIFVICPKGIDIDSAVTSQISTGNFNQL